MPTTIKKSIVDHEPYQVYRKISQLIDKIEELETYANTLSKTKIKDTYTAAEKEQLSPIDRKKLILLGFVQEFKTCIGNPPASDAKIESESPKDTKPPIVELRSPVKRPALQDENFWKKFKLYFELCENLDQSTWQTIQFDCLEATAKITPHDMNLLEKHRHPVLRWLKELVALVCTGIVGSVAVTAYHAYKAEPGRFSLSQIGFYAKTASINKLDGIYNLMENSEEPKSGRSKTPRCVRTLDFDISST